MTKYYYYADILLNMWIYWMKGGESCYKLFLLHHIFSIIGKINSNYF
jgi:hypothetical protein